MGPVQLTQKKWTAEEVSLSEKEGDQETENVVFAQGLPRQEVFIGPLSGVTPHRVDRVRGELLYPIELNGVLASALWDPRAGASFISSQKVSKLGLKSRPLARPLRLEVWDGPGTVITHHAVVEKVTLGNKEGKW